MTNRIQFETWGIRGDIAVPAYVISDGFSSDAENISRGIAAKNRAGKYWMKPAGKGADGSYRDYELIMARRDGAAIGDLTFRVYVDAQP